MNEQTAQRLKELVTDIHGQFWRLSGKRNKTARAFLIKDLTGSKPLAADCGINKLMLHLYAKFPVDAFTCEADREKKLAEKILNFNDYDAELFVVISNGGFGKSTTLQAAGAWAFERGNLKLQAICLAYRFTGPVSELMKVSVSLTGNLEHPDTVTKERLFGAGGGTEKTLQQIINGQ